MKIKDLLLENQTKLTDKWFKAIIDTYPAESDKLFIDIKDKFANPVGNAFREALPVIFESIVGSAGDEETQKALAAVIRIRAVQDYTPAEAVSYLFILKDVLRSELIDKTESKKDLKAYLEIESNIDQAACITFGLYMEMKEKIFELKANQVKNTFGKMVDKLNAKYDKYKRN